MCPGVGLTKFCELRPAHMKFVDQSPIKCVCSYHQIVRVLQLNVALKEYTDALEPDFSSFIEQVTCDATLKTEWQVSRCCREICSSSQHALHYQQWLVE